MTRRGWVAVAVAVLVNAGIVVGVLVAPGSEGAVRHASTRHHASVVTTSSSTEDTTPIPAPPPAAVPVDLGAGPLAPVVSRVQTTDPVIFLGIDDGLVRDPRVLALLEHVHIPFMMFLTQVPAHQGAAYWQQAIAAGGTVEAHTIDHPDLTRLGPEQQRHEICGTLDDFQRLFGRRPTLFRPPFGKYNASVRAIARSCGFKAVVMWMGATNDERLDVVGNKLQAGDILLMHWRTDLYENLKLVLAQARARGLTVGRLEDYLSPG